MTPKEKARELIQEMCHVNVSNISEFGMEWNMAKQCALIAVDKILNIPFEYEKERQFFQEVKQEIEKL